MRTAQHAAAKMTQASEKQEKHEQVLDNRWSKASRYQKITAIAEVQQLTTCEEIYAQLVHYNSKLSSTKEEKWHNLIEAMKKAQEKAMRPSDDISAMDTSK